MKPDGSGFSFADLSTDYAGVAFAVRLRHAGLAEASELATSFAVSDGRPDRKDLQYRIGRHGPEHPVIASYEPGERWACCYVDQTEVAVPAQAVPYLR